jgi:hypothetical protein
VLSTKIEINCIASVTEPSLFSAMVKELCRNEKIDPKKTTWVRSTKNTSLLDILIFDFDVKRIQHARSPAKVKSLYG